MNLPAFIAGAILNFVPPIYGAGGVLLCNEFGCRSSPYFPPPIVSVAPPVVYMPANPPVRRPPPPAYNGPPGPPAQVYAPNPNGGPAVRVFPPGALGPRYTQPRRDPPPQRDAEAAEIEGDITAFCDAHPDEPFCGKLGHYLRTHPRK